MYSDESTPKGGFPHSDIPGSKLACQLPESFRRLPRPSSPVIAKASTTCTYSLDPITLKPFLLRYRSYLKRFAIQWTCIEWRLFDAIKLLPIEHLPLITKGLCSLYFFHFVKEHSSLKARSKPFRLLLTSKVFGGG